MGNDIVDAARTASERTTLGVQRGERTERCPRLSPSLWAVCSSPGPKTTLPACLLQAWSQRGSLVVVYTIHYTLCVDLENFHQKKKIGLVKKKPTVTSLESKATAGMVVETSIALTLSHSEPGRMSVCNMRTNLLVERLSLNRSQCGGCSTKYDTPTES